MRAVNVAGHARVSMRAVQQAFSSAGCQNVQTIIQSGNILFDASVRGCGDVMRRARRELQRLLGEEPQIILKTVPEIEAIVAGEPFARYTPTPRVKFYVAFLAQRPRRVPAFPVSSSKEMLEAIAIVDREVFIVSRIKQTGFFGFPNNFIEERLGVAATTRNWSTVTKIAALSRSLRESACPGS